jgi:ribosomal RNA assembly protein
MTSQEYSYELKIPKDRVAVLIGKKGIIKKQIETSTKTKLNIDSKEGDVIISGKDALGLYNAKEVVMAVGRGFNPEIAQLLLKGDYLLDILNIGDYVSLKANAVKRMKGRVIGTEGRSRENIERLTECYVSVYGKTIAIIGQPDNISNARKAVEDLLRGSPHGNVYKWLERQRKEMKKKELLGE